MVSFHNTFTVVILLFFNIFGLQALIIILLLITIMSIIIVSICSIKGKNDSAIGVLKQFIKG